MMWTEIHGWFNYSDLYDRFVERTPDGGIGVEIGAWLGKSAAYMAGQIRDSGKQIEFYTVDPGFGSIGHDQALHAPIVANHGGNNTGKLLCNLRDCGVLDHVVVLPTTSIRAAKMFKNNSLDWVFIDGDHRKESVEADLKAWWPKVKKGGVLSGHDLDQHWPSVVEAVTEFFGYTPHDPICSHCFSVVK